MVHTYPAYLNLSEIRTYLNVSLASQRISIHTAPKLDNTFPPPQFTPWHDAKDSCDGLSKWRRRCCSHRRCRSRCWSHGDRSWCGLGRRRRRRRRRRRQRARCTDWQELFLLRHGDEDSDEVLTLYTDRYACRCVSSCVSGTYLALG